MNNRQQISENEKAQINRVILRVLVDHEGQKKAIRRADLLAALRSVGLCCEKSGDRKMRCHISEMRKAGNLIGATSGEGGYFMFASPAEADEFCEREERPRAESALQTISAIQKAVFAKWGTQMGLRI
jgi:hypothetical protein